MLKGSSIDSLVCISVTFSLWQLHSTTYACFNSFFFFFFTPQMCTCSSTTECYQVNRQGERRRRTYLSVLPSLISTQRHGDLLPLPVDYSIVSYFILFCFIRSLLLLYCFLSFFFFFHIRKVLSLVTARFSVSRRFFFFPRFLSFPHRSRKQSSKKKKKHQKQRGSDEALQQRPVCVVRGYLRFEAEKACRSSFLLLFS